MSWYRLFMRGTGGLLLGAVLPGVCFAETTSTAAIEPKAEQIMRDFTSELESADTISFHIDSSMKIGMQDTDNEMKSVYDVFFERPDKLALILTESGLGSTYIINGTTDTIYFPMQNAYVQRPASGGIDEMIGIGGMDMGTRFAAAMWGDQPFEALMDGVTSGVYLGITDLDTTPCHHLKFGQEQFEWEAWVSAESNPPLLHQIKLEMIQPDSGSDKSGFGGMSFSVAVKLTDWKFDEPIPAEKFTFTPPPGATDASEIATDETSPLPHPLLGMAAPELNLPLLDGGIAKSADLTSKVVVLDFWATWSAPCRRALPILDRVAGNFANEEVSFFAVNMAETTSTAKAFVDDQKLGLTVAIDDGGETAKAFGVESVPATFLIGRDGRIQAVHEGLLTNAEEELTSEIKALLRGETLAKPSVIDQADGTTSAPELVKRWSHPGTWHGVDFDAASDSIVALSLDEQFAKIDTAGKETQIFEIAAKVSRVRLAQLDQTPEMELLAFSAWGDAVYAFSTSGTELWNKPGGSGIDDVAAGDLTGDGIDEVIIGYNGGTGLHALTGEGKPLWEYKNIGNVWHVDTGDVDGDGKTNVVTTSAAGKIHIFSEDGKKLRDISADFYCNMVRVAETTGTSTRILATGSGRTGEVMGCYDHTGKKYWQVSLTRKDGNVDSAAVSPDGKMVAVGIRDGAVYAINIASGEIVGKVTDQGRIPEVGWASVDDGQLLLVATGSSLNAFTVK